MDRFRPIAASSLEGACVTLRPKTFFVLEEPTARLGVPGQPLPSQRAFVIQLRAQTDPNIELFIGRVEHMPSGAATRFCAVDDRVAFITKMLAPEKEAQ